MDAAQGRCGGGHPGAPHRSLAGWSIAVGRGRRRECLVFDPSTLDQSQCATPGQGSTAGFPDASDAQAEELFTENFRCILDSLAADPGSPQACSRAIQRRRFPRAPPTGRRLTCR